MGFFSKLFKKSNDAPETKELQNQNTVEECSIGEDVPDIIEREQEVEASIAVEEPIPEVTGVQEIEYKQEIITEEEKQAILSASKSYDITYESYFESEQILRLQVLISFISKVWKSGHVASQFPGVVDQINELGSMLEQLLPTLNTLQEEVQQFRVKDTNLRTIIENYTKVITEINAKKLKDKEFQQVKEKLDPQLEAIKKQREDFLVQENAINTKINLTMKKLDKMYVLSKEIAKKI